MSIPTSLTKQILQLNHPQQKFSNESIELTSEFMKLFIVEARRRASIQAECEAETEIIDTSSKQRGGKYSRKDNDDGSDNSFMMDDNVSSSGSSSQRERKTIEITADHIAKIVAELMMDLS